MTDRGTIGAAESTTHVEPQSPAERGTLGDPASTEPIVSGVARGTLGEPTATAPPDPTPPRGETGDSTSTTSPQTPTLRHRGTLGDAAAALVPATGQRGHLGEATSTVPSADEDYAHTRITIANRPTAHQLIGAYRVGDTWKPLATITNPAQHDEKTEPSSITFTFSPPTGASTTAEHFRVAAGIFESSQRLTQPGTWKLTVAAPKASRTIEITVAPADKP